MLLDLAKLIHRLLLLLLIDADACDLFDNLSAFIRSHLDEACDVSLEDDVIAIRIYPCRPEQLDDFVPRRFLIIYPVDACT